MKCVSLFSGAGGLDLGLAAAGFDVVASLENDRDCCETLEKNGRTNVLFTDVSQVDFLDVVGSDDIALLAGGPPCQPFSKSALWTQRGTRGLSDPRTGTINHYVRAIATIRPAAFVLENVEGFAKWGGLSLIEKAVADMTAGDLRYQVTSAVLDAADFGVPQKRKRFFAIGIAGGPKFDFPVATHGDGRTAYTTSWDALVNAHESTGDEKLKIKGRWADLIPSVPPGKNYLWHTSRGEGLSIFGWRTRFWSFLYKLDPLKPSPTIVASPSQNSGPFHWNNRLLSTSELAALQTFPLSYRFQGNRASRQRQIGNAVPPLLAEKLGRALLVHLGGVPGKQMTHEIQRTISAPDIEPTVPVPSQFLHLVGGHADHPGAGLGPRPRRYPTRSEEATL